MLRTWKFAITPIFLLVVFFSVRNLQESTVTIQAVVLMALATVLKSTKDTFRTSLVAHELFGFDALSLVLERVALLAVEFFSYW